MLPLTIQHNGQEVPWLACTLKKSLDNVCHSATVTLDDIGELKPHERIELHWQEQLLSTLLVDSVSLRLTPTQRRYTLALRSPARDIIDSTWDEDYSGTLEQASSKVADRFGLKVKLAQGASTQKIAAFSTEAESPWDRLVSQARTQGLVFTSLPDGHLILSKIADDTSRNFDTAIMCSWSTVFDGRQQFAQYQARSTPAGSETAITLADDQCHGSRTLALNLQGYNDEDALKKRLQNELERRRRPTCTLQVSSWEQDGQLWDINTMFELDYQGLQAQLLLNEVTFTANDKQLKAELKLTSKEAYL